MSNNDINNGNSFNFYANPSFENTSDNNPFIADSTQYDANLSEDGFSADAEPTDIQEEQPLDDAFVFVDAMPEDTADAEPTDIQEEQPLDDSFVFVDAMPEDTADAEPTDIQEEQPLDDSFVFVEAMPEDTADAEPTDTQEEQPSDDISAYEDVQSEDAVNEESTGSYDEQTSGDSSEIGEASAVEPKSEPESGENPESGDLIIVEEEKGVTRPDTNLPILSRALYHERYYLLYGDKKENSLLNPSKTKDYLLGLGFGNSSLKQAREGKDVAALIEKTFDPTRPGAHFCDFCGDELVGTEYEILADGRERCMQCGRSAVKTAKEFVEIFTEVKQKMEGFFDIKFNAPVHVEMTTAKKLQKRIGETYKPTSGFDARAVGVAIRDEAGYTLLIENGTPRVSTIMTIAHELTHIWQYLNWDDAEIINNYGPDDRLEIYEGMSKWVEIQYALLINEVATATRQKILTLYRDDEYGRGFVRYINRYPMSKGSSVTKETPFMNGNHPL